MKINEVVDLLFSFRGRALGDTYVNKTLIPLLCRKAGVPRQDARGTITSHRARSTIASQLYNAKEPLSLFDLQEWLGPPVAVIDAALCKAVTHEGGESLRESRLL